MAWLTETETVGNSTRPPSSAGGVPLLTESESSSKALLNIIPKGLRSFDVEDADFFLGLLPGPRDRDGVPDCIRFWKNRIEERDTDETFGVGLMYGPSVAARPRWSKLDCFRV